MNMTLNESYFEVTPDQNALKHPFFGNHAINRDYSINQFQKKKTLSKNKFDLGEESMVSQFAISQVMNKENDGGLVINSPFGPISPMPNQNARSRASNVIRDSCGNDNDLLSRGLLQFGKPAH